MSETKTPQVTQEQLSFLDRLRQVFTFGEGSKPAAAATFTDAQLNQRLADQRQQLSQEFGGQLAALENKLGETQQASEKKVTQLSEQQRDREVDAWWSEGVKQGRILPAFEEAYGLQSLLRQLASSPVELTFTEKQEGKDVEVKRSGAQVLMRFLDELPKTVRFDHITRKARAAARGGKVLNMVESGTREITGVEKDARVRALIAESKTKNPDRPLTYAEGLQMVNEQDAAEGAGQEA